MTLEHRSRNLQVKIFQFRSFQVKRMQHSRIKSKLNTKRETKARRRPNKPKEQFAVEEKEVLQT